MDVTAVALLIVMTMGPVILSWVILCRVTGAESAPSPLPLALGAGVGAVAGWTVLPWLLNFFPAQPLRPDAHHSSVGQYFYYVGLFAWIGGLAGLVTATSALSRRAAGWVGLVFGVLTAAFVVLLNVEPDPDFVPHPFWWRLFVSDGGAPFLYLSLALVLWSVWLLRRGKAGALDG